MYAVEAKRWADEQSVRQRLPGALADTAVLTVYSAVLVASDTSYARGSPVAVRIAFPLNAIEQVFLAFAATRVAASDTTS